MKHLLSLMAVLLAGSALAQQLPSTGYTRDFLRATGQTNALAKLGIVTTNQSIYATPAATNLDMNGFNITDIGTMSVGSLTGTNGFPVLLSAVTNANDGGSLTNVVTRQNILYVDPAGDDATAVAGDASLPWATFGNAVSNAPAGSVVVLAPGDYYEGGSGCRAVGRQCHGTTGSRS